MNVWTDATEVDNLFLLSENKSISLNYTNKDHSTPCSPKRSSYLRDDIEPASQL